MSVTPQSPGPSPLRRALKRHWGYDSFRPLQEPAIQAILDRRDSLVVLPTGAGKSICYQLPAVVRGGTTVVVSPLIALMKDQVDQLRARDIAAAALESARCRRRNGTNSSATLSRAGCGCSLSRPSAWRRAGSASSWPSCASAPSPSTRATASATGAMTFGPSIGSWASFGTCSPKRRFTPSRLPPPSAFAATSSPSCGCAIRWSW